MRTLAQPVQVNAFHASVSLFALLVYKDTLLPKDLLLVFASAVLLPAKLVQVPKQTAHHVSQDILNQDGNARATRMWASISFSKEMT